MPKSLVFYKWFISEVLKISIYIHYISKVWVMNTFIPHGRTKLIKGDSKDIYNVSEE